MRFVNRALEASTVCTVELALLKIHDVNGRSSVLAPGWGGGGGGGGGGTPYNGLYVEAPPERGTLFSLEVYKRVAISRAEVRKGKTDI